MRNDIEVLDIDNTAVRESQIKRIKEMKASRNEAAHVNAAH